MIQAFFAHQRHRSAFTCLVLVGFIIVGLNWPREQLKVSFSQGKREVNDTALKAKYTETTEQPQGSAIGWPVAVETDSFWNAIAINLGVAFGICLFSVSIVLLIQAISTFRVGSATSFDRRLVVITAFTCILGTICAARVCYHYAAEIIAERTLIRELRSLGEIGLVTNVSTMIASRVPSAFLVPFSKVESFSGTADGLSLMHAVSRCDTLRSVTIEGGVINDDVWSSIVNCTSLESLRFDNCTIDITQPLGNPQSEIRTLSLNRCTAANSILASLKSLPNLTSLAFMRSPLSEAKDVDRFLPRNIQDLRMAIDFSEGGRMNLSGFSHLESLKLDSVSRQTSDQVFSLTLNASPQLKSVSLTPTVPFDLAATDVPRLHSITAYQYVSRNRSNEGDYAPLSIRHLSINGAPCLQSLYLDASNLERIEFFNTPNLRKLTIGLGNYSNGFGSHRVKDLIKRLYQGGAKSWFNDLAICDGPTSLDLTGIPLVETDLTPLRENKRIKELILQSTGVQVKQLLAIDHGHRIKSIDLQGSPIAHDELQALLESYRGIERLQMDTGNLKNLEIVDQPQLTQLLGPTSQSATSVRIVNCPKLTGNLMLGRGVKKIELQGVQSLQSLSIKGLLPKDAILEGFRDLKMVELRGRSVTDQHMEAILSCKSLEELMLSMPNVTPATLIRLNALTELLVLHLSGSKVNDDVINGLQKLNQLREVDLSFTDITGKSLVPLAQRPNLQRLCVNHTRIQSHELAPITQMQRLIELEIAGINIPPTILRECLQPSLLERLNLSDSLLTSETLDILSGSDADHLLFLGLKRCGLNDDQVRRIADAHPKLALDINENEISAELVQSLEKNGRLVPAGDRLAFERYLEKLEGNPHAAEWLGTQAARFLYGSRPYAISPFAPTAEPESWPTGRPLGQSYGWIRRKLAGLEKKARFIP